MADLLTPVLRTSNSLLLTGIMATYNSQEEASAGIPKQWQSFLQQYPALANHSGFYGASPCSDDRKIHYLTGIAHGTLPNVTGREYLSLASGEYAVVHLNDPASLRETWSWLLSTWLATSGYEERSAPEFECFTAISPDGTPAGSVELWIPVEPRDLG